MRVILLLTLLLPSLPLPAQRPASPRTPEQLGTVSFPVSCAAGSQAGMNRGVALLHDFWYSEAKVQFAQVAKKDPHCAMAEWGLAMSGFHQIWDRPDADGMKLGWTEMAKAEALQAGTARERAYIAALADFFRPGAAKYPARIAAYSDAMGALYARFPSDVDAGAFYALSLLAEEKPGDTSLGQQHKAMSVLTPLFARAPDDPGVDHYIVHACDNPAMAAEGLSAANHYLEIAASGPHAYHMPGHIYARLGMWPQDIDSQLGSIAASRMAEAHGEGGLMDEPHSYDFLLYAYLQSGQDEKARNVLNRMPAMLKQIAAMPNDSMEGMAPYYRTKYDVFYELESRDWKAAAGFEPVAGTSPEVKMLAYWARLIADGHLRRADQARADLAKYDALVVEVLKGKDAYLEEGTEAKVFGSEVRGWAVFAEGRQAEAIAIMREAADLQDKVGQGEVDIPAREMLADMLLDEGQPRQALAEYQAALKLSPNRLNGLYGAGRAAEAAGEKARAESYFAALLRSTDGGAHSTRPELQAAKAFMAAKQMAVPPGRSSADRLRREE